MPDSWYRDNIDPMLTAQPRRPFFFAWDPQNFPREVGYAWLTNNPVPVIDQSAAGMSRTATLAMAASRLLTR